MYEMAHQLAFRFTIFLGVLSFFASDCVAEKFNYTAKENWPEYNNFGQISGVSIDTSGNVYIFHRGDRVWDSETFSQFNIFINKERGPISMETIVVLDSDRGSLITKSGSSLFYIPHGLTVDHENNIWVTDVALHQVFKFSPLITLDARKNVTLGKPLLSLGKAFEPGRGDNQFCKPTYVAVDTRNNDFFVSDGYCNSRVIKYDKGGRKLFELGRSTIYNPQNNLYMLDVPHAIVLGEKDSVLYVADRENFRVVSYDSKNGTSEKAFAQELRSQVFSVAYSNMTNLWDAGGLLFVLTNSSTFPKTVSIYGAKSASFLQHLVPQSRFENPHDLAVTKDGSICYVVELNPCKIWKFELEFQSENGGLITSQLNEEINKTQQSTNEINKVVKLEGDNTILALGLVIFVIVMSFILFVYHYRKRHSTDRRYEFRRLILDEDDDYSGITGMRLT